MNVRDAVGSLLVCAVLLLPACSQTATESPSQNEETKAKPVPVKAVSVLEEDLPRTSTQPATVSSYYEAEIQAKISGYVKEVKADIGDFVEKDTVLAVLAVPEMDKRKEILQAQLQRSEALEDQATAGVELAKADVLSAEARLAQARSEMRRVEASLAAAESEFRRIQDLVERQSLAQRVLDEVREKRDSELAAREAVTSAITSAQADVTVAKAKQSAAESELKVAEANTTVAEKEQEEFQELLNYATLKAPFPGVVTQRSLDPGDLVQKQDAAAGQTLFVVSQIDRLRVQIPVPEADAALVDRGDKITLNFPFYSQEQPVPGSVTRWSHRIDRNTRTMLVEAEIENPDRKLLPGMFGQATIDLSTKVATRTLPARAVRFDETGKAYVYVLSDDDKVTVTDVTTGLDTGHSIEILTGVEAGQRVIDAHRERFTDGQPVTVLK